MKVDIVDVCTYVDVLNPNWPQFCLYDPLAQDVSSWYELYDSVMISGTTLVWFWIPKSHWHCELLLSHLTEDESNTLHKKKHLYQPTQGRL